MKKRLALVLLLALLAVGLMPAAAQEDASLDALLREFVAADEPGMVLYLAWPDETYVAAAGQADLATGRAIAPDDLFRIGSTTKWMVSTVVLQLVEEGVFGLDDPLSMHLPPSVLTHITYGDATIRQLLNHTSGAPEYYDSDAYEDAIAADRQYPWQAAEELAYTYDRAPYFAPGTSWEYTNTNYIVAEILIQAGTGMPLRDQLGQRIFAPLGMDSCYLEDPARLAEGLMLGYVNEEGDFVDVSRWNDGFGLGDGGVICNAADLALFPRGLLEGELLGAAMLAAMQDLLDTGDGSGYGLGLSYKVVNRVALYGHEGSSGGFNCDLQYAPDDDLVIVILTNNFDSTIMDDVLAAALDWARAE